MRWSKKAKEVLTTFAANPRSTSKGVVVPTTKTVKSQVARLTKQVKKLNKVSYDQVTLRMGNSQAFVQAPYYVYNCTNGMNTWGPIFGSDATDIAAVQKMYVNSYKFDVRLTQSSEPDLIFYIAFVVSLKDQANDAQTWLNSTTGALVLTPGIHYEALGNDGRVMMNTKYFNIHSQKRFYLGGRPNDQSAPAVKDLSFTIKPKQKLVENPGGNIFGTISGRNGLAFPRDPSQNYFFILFNDNAGADFENNFVNMSGLAQVAIPS